jgi:hypothetical protein
MPCNGLLHGIINDSSQELYVLLAAARAVYTFGHNVLFLPSGDTNESSITCSFYCPTTKSAANITSQIYCLCWAKIIVLSMLPTLARSQFKSETSAQIRVISRLTSRNPLSIKARTLNLQVSGSESTSVGALHSGGTSRRVFSNPSTKSVISLGAAKYLSLGGLNHRSHEKPCGGNSSMTFLSEIEISHSSKEMSRENILGRL